MGDREITVRASVAAVGSSPGLSLPDYVLTLGSGLGRGRLYRAVPGDASTADGLKVLAVSGGYSGTWQEIRQPRDGAALTNASVTIQVGSGELRTLPAATLDANRTLTLGTTNAERGDAFWITRLDVGAFTYAIVNGGIGAGTLITMPVSVRYWAWFYFDGTNWTIRGGGTFVT